MRGKINKACLLLGLAFSFTLRGQFYSLPPDYFFNLRTEQQLASANTALSQGMQPYIPSFSSRHLFAADTSVVFRFIKEDPGIDVIFRKHLIEARPRDEKFILRIDPLLNLEAGKDLEAQNGGLLYTNTRGVVASGTVGEDFYFETIFSENQAVVPEYVRDQALARMVMPGQGRWKTFKTQGFDYAFASGIGSIRLGRHVNLQFGHGKHKTGRGYRSLLLSDNAFNYPFVRISQQYFGGRVQYTNLYASLMNLRQASAVITPGAERLFQKKSAAFQYLEMQLHPRLTLSLFQGLVWEQGDSRNRQHLAFQYFNPVIFAQLAEFGFDHPQHNANAGGDLLVKVTDRIQVYGQGLVDRIDQSASAGCAVQAGVRLFDFLKVKHLTVQGEINETGRKAYTTRGVSHYTHYNQNLAYTPSNCTELIAIADYRHRRITATVKLHSQRLKDSPSEKIEIYDLRAGYLINPSYNLLLSAGYLSRYEKFHTFGAQNPNTAYFFFSVTTSIYNRYYDF